MKNELESSQRPVIARRSFLKGLGIAGATLLPATTILMTEGKALGRELRRGLTQGDVDILRFLAAAEILETDLWQQYNELAGVQDREVSGGTGNAAFIAALEVLDGDMPQYTHDNTDDENSHQKFLNAFLKSVGAEPVDLEPFRTLQGSQASGADTTKRRLTNLMQLTVDTTWFTRYRANKNPDVDPNFVFPPAVPGLAIGKHPAIPRNNADLVPPLHLQAIANTAGFHFATIEQGGSSLYGSFIPKATSKVVLRILYAIGGSEVAHFQTWHDKAGNAPPLTDPVTGLVFPDLNSMNSKLFQTNLIMPEPCDFISRDLPKCSIIRPTLTKNAGAMAAATFLTNMGLFIGQSPQFFKALKGLAAAADKARRECDFDHDDDE
jgi:hypothetical protein